ncbi:MAG: sigma-54-dependent Fis family transcriptional regulator [Verrucomicrobia bacterium]|nr:MAG: sigma-54-dependent Fis family transcriptional regulator [Verrucomicrobiota bacterium]
MTKVLTIEDDTSFAKLLKVSLEEIRSGPVKEQIRVELATSLDEGLARAQEGEFDVVVADFHLGVRKALELTARLRTLRPHLPVIIMTGKHTTEKAIEAIKSGAYDYFAKPDVFDFDDRSQLAWPWVLELAEMIGKAAESKRRTDKVRLPDDTAISEANPGDRMEGKSSVMQAVFKAIGRVAASDITVLIRGETGTGKELAARAVYSHSNRKGRPLIVVNCAAIPENLLESEMFGHEQGAFTDAHVRRIGRFEQAEGGTIFLDEIGDMSLPLQQKLLRVLQEKTIERVGGKETIPVDVRVIAATHRNLELSIQAGEFREDLYYRLNVATIDLPALRERPEDIPDLARYFVQRYRVELGSAGSTISPEEESGVMDYLQKQPWPGNVRQMKNVIRKALLLARGYAIGLEVVQQAFAQMVPPCPAADQAFADYVGELLARAQNGELENVHQTLTETADRELYSQTIQRANGDQSMAARWLGVSRPTMLEKLMRFGLHPARSAEKSGV